ncbi:hypothetical protein C8J56DRAFT_173372 [Mycena floridula]|nr:hypothetical protein C8J56DRAFT_173372 [Mycena floridula]
MVERRCSCDRVYRSHLALRCSFLKIHTLHLRFTTSSEIIQSHPQGIASLAFFLSLLTAFTTLYNQLLVQLRSRTERFLLWPAFGAIAGHWLGVIPIALDRNRPWQAWPLTPAFRSIFDFSRDNNPRNLFVKLEAKRTLVLDTRF